MAESTEEEMGENQIVVDGEQTTELGHTEALLEEEAASANDVAVDVTIDSEADVAVGAEDEEEGAEETAEDEETENSEADVAVSVDVEEEDVEETAEDEETEDSEADVAASAEAEEEDTEETAEDEETEDSEADVAVSVDVEEEDVEEPTEDEETEDSEADVAVSAEAEETKDSEADVAVSAEAEEEDAEETAEDEEVEEEPERPEGVAWFVVHSYSGYENKVKKNLEHRIESMGMLDQIFQVVVPTEEEVELRDGQRRTTERRVFPGYILVEMLMNDDTWYVVRNTPGVTDFVRSGTKPIPLRQEEVDKILNRMEAAAPKIKVSFREGQKVRIVDGPFEDFMGTVDTIDTDHARVRVLVNMFGRETPVEVDFLQVERV
jgi:transcriptional antiterminator NusG